ncbi:MAG: trypsin-like peptidase domain-containing protein [Burkholderiaceae bacterium]
MTDPTTHEADTEVIASLEHLTGRSPGSVHWLSGPAIELRLSGDGRVHAGSRGGDARGFVIARLQAVSDTYALEVGDEHEVWVNGKPVHSRVLRDGDLIELGERGPLTRLRLHRQDSVGTHSAREILSDGLAYLRASRMPWPRRVARLVRTMAMRLARQTTIWFRVLVTMALIALSVFSYQQYRLNIRQEARISQGLSRLDGVAAALARAQQESLRPADLSAFRQEARSRLSALERQSSAVATVIADALASVGFIQGSYGFRQLADGRMLRHVVDAEGLPVLLPSGQPLLTTEGEGPVAELQFTGTGFVLAGESVIVTNRHIARPWELATGSSVLADGALEPVMMRFRIFFPGQPQAVALSAGRASDEADLAILQPDTLPPGVPGLMLAEHPPATGEDVVVLGYPTGLRSMLAQAGSEFIEELAQSGAVDFWMVAETLAARGMISPLASRGIVGRQSGAAIVYDAETTHGGSGGPVLDVQGRVIAVNTAILPEYGGSNLGVPADALRRLLRP